MKYDHVKIEKKWQDFWDKHKTFKTEDNFAKPKYYVLDMFPYPSGAGLHVGHLVGYTATDIIARYKRALGFNVLHPMGWDSFGLPAEQYAIRTGTHPAVSTKENIANFKRQMKAVGFSYDWDREIATSEPSYYKWTQWIFTKLYEQGLAYEAEMLVNFCPTLGTVLANEEVEDGVTKEGGYPVERRPLKQWILKITAYADRLIQDLDLVDWPESLKKLQINWIGKSEGAHIDFKTEDGAQTISVFTTRADTLFGATYLVIAPEHSLVNKLTTADQKADIENYCQETAKKSDLSRTDLNKNKTGVFTGSYAINPVNQQKIPIWVSDYVLMMYGTGAVMAVPAHDERDFEFATKFNLPIETVVKSVTDEEIAGCFAGEGTIVNSASHLIDVNGLSSNEAKHKITDFLAENKLGKATTTYKLRDWLFSRQRYWGEPFPILKLADGTTRLLDEDELPLLPPELSDYRPSPDGKSPLARVQDWVEIEDQKSGQRASRETNIMPQWAGSCWYYLRFMDPQNQQKAWSPELEKYWMPVDLYVGGVEHAVLHLLYARFWHKVLYDIGYVTTLEPFQTLKNQGLMVARSYQNSAKAYVEPNFVKEEDEGFIDVRTGDKLTSQIDKMSKSKLNGISPDLVIKEYGADCLRLYEMFMGPLEKEKVWNSEALSGCYRFLNRFYDISTSEKLIDEDLVEADKLAHKLVKKVQEDIETMQFNTAIARLMEFVNDFTKLKKYPVKAYKMAVQALAPFAPHIAEEIWQNLGEAETIAYKSFPIADEKLLVEEQLKFVIQVNGKLRAQLEMNKDISKDELYQAALKIENVVKHMANNEPKKIIFVPGKLLNIVV